MRWEDFSGHDAQKTTARAEGSESFAGEEGADGTYHFEVVKLPGGRWWPGQVAALVSVRMT